MVSYSDARFRARYKDILLLGTILLLPFVLIIDKIRKLFDLSQYLTTKEGARYTRQQIPRH